MRTGNAAELVHIFHDIFAARFDVCEEGCAVGHALEVVDVQLDADGMSHGDEVQHGVG